ncbi:Metallo-beta-lactamase superfamily protein [Mycena sanguinolenta]|uniref:Metallo-beta-lactamase superfamily protein n=1 Tax=Mycena sanguinolenta TaxID=230812 RepID=A0A8H6X6B5_9AGAR|nr:Metallo-beta-lactamase superfamily protein [Mycena sanguinolenta]
MRVLSGLSVLSLLAGVYASSLDLKIPSSNATVDVRVFNVANGSIVNSANTLFAPILPGRETANVPLYSFLIEHSQKRLMFDLGTRTDPQNFAPSVASLFTSGIIQLEQQESFKDIAELLQDGGNSPYQHRRRHLEFFVSLKVPWLKLSQGDMSKFSNSTELIIGSETDTRTYPTFPNATLQTSDLADRKVTKIDFTKANLTFSGLNAIDYFGDGSFYLVNTPGHLPGHLTALARTTPTTFILLGGDTFHHVGEARPRPLFQQNFPCPAHLLEESKSAISTDFFWSPLSRDGAFDMLSRSRQFLAISDQPDSFYADPVTAQVSLEKLAKFDADPDILVLVAHDLSLRSYLPYFPAYLNHWKARGLKEANVWNFINTSNPAFIFSPT